jgi:hypothetical protein
LEYVPDNIKDKVWELYESGGEAEDDETDDAPPSPVPVEKTKCDHCGAQLKPGAAFCTKCGKKV